jgi:hypothetical protein
MYEVRIEKHWEDKNYNVQVVLWEKNGSGMSFGKAFDVPYKKAMKVAEEQSKIYNAPIVKKY